MLITRLTKVIMSFALGLFCLLVAFDNIFAPATNYTFVQHVLSMDTTFPESGVRYRAITNPISLRRDHCGRRICRSSVRSRSNKIVPRSQRTCR